MWILYLYFLIDVTVLSLLTTQKQTDLRSCKKLKCPTHKDLTCVRITYENPFKNLSFNVIVHNKCEIGYIRCHSGLKASVLPMKECHLHNGTNFHKRSKREISNVLPERTFQKVGKGKRVYLYGDNLSDSSFENNNLESKLKLSHTKSNQKLTQQNTIETENENRNDENGNYDDDKKSRMNSNEALVELKDRSTEKKTNAKKNQSDLSGSVHVISNEIPVVNDDKSIDETNVNNSDDEGNNDKPVPETNVDNDEGIKDKSIDGANIDNNDKEVKDKSGDGTNFDNNDEEVKDKSGDVADFDNNDEEVKDKSIDGANFDNNDEEIKDKSGDGTNFDNNDEEVKDKSGDGTNFENNDEDNIKSIDKGDQGSVNVNDKENPESNVSENQDEIQNDDSGEKKSVINNDKLVDDYAVEEQSGDLEEDNKDCPSVCALRDRMVCARCSHGIYRTFMSVCHLRAFICTHTDENLSLVSRSPCMQSAPFLSDFPPTNGRAHDPGDRVLQFIQCRSEGRLLKNDPKCNFSR